MGSCGVWMGGGIVGGEKGGGRGWWKKRRRTALAQVALIALLILTQGVLLRPIQPTLLNSQEVTKVLSYTTLEPRLL